MLPALFSVITTRRGTMVWVARKEWIRMGVVIIRWLRLCSSDPAFFVVLFVDIYVVVLLLNQFWH